MRVFSYKITVATLLVGAVMLLGGIGCTDRLSGDKTENKDPNVWFVNVPPDGTRTSTNPIVNWVGQDIDGQVVQFRYVVYSEEDILNRMPSATLPLDSTELSDFIGQHVQGQLDSLWTYLEVDQIAGEPRSSNIIPMSAEIEDPVRTFVRQYVFVQAIDDLGAMSEIVYRSFLRNDNPPDTRIIGFLGGPYINSTFAQGPITGIRMRWQGSDVLDFPTDPPPFEFEWRLYGPYFSYFDDEAPDSTWEELQQRFIKAVFVTRDAQIFRFGEGDTALFCDTFPEVDTAGNVIQVERCDTLLIDTITANNLFGSIDTILDIDDPDFAGNPRFDRVARQSFQDGDEWTSITNDSIYDAFNQFPSDTTQEQAFIFWVRSRDDALVPDLTPAFVTFSVVDPQYERDIAVIDIAASFDWNAPRNDSARAFWNRAVQAWIDNGGAPPGTEYDPAVDFIQGQAAAGINVSLRQMLSHKVLIAYDDNAIPGLMNNQEYVDQLTRAVDAGVNLWACGRAQLTGGEGDVPILPDFFPTLSSDLRSAMDDYFGIRGMAYTGWGSFLFQFGLKIEDFIGAESIDSTRWPDLDVDTARLHAIHSWPFGWDPNVAALPEVEWFVRAPGTQIMYLYKTKYPEGHILANPLFNFGGRPVMHRFPTSLFRTVWSAFTPITLEQDQAQELVNNVMNWLYDPDLGSSDEVVTARTRYPDAAVSITPAELGVRHWERMKERALENPDLQEYHR